MKIMMFAHAGSLNRGCEAIVRSSTQLIKERIADARVLLTSERPETDRLLDKVDEIRDGKAQPVSRFSLDGVLAALSYKLRGDESYALGKIHRNVIRHIPEVDVCLSIGGDNYCYGEQPGWYEIDRQVKRQGKKLVLWGCSIGEEDMSERKLEDLRLFDLILARETLTYGMLRSKGLTNVRLCADAAFTMEKEELPLPSGWQEGNTLGFNFSPLVWKRNERSRDAARALVAHILSTTSMSIALTPHVVEEGNNDYDLLRQFEEEFAATGRVFLLPDHLSATQVKGYIARMRFFVGARTHATIAAYSSLVPTLVLGYSVKSKGIARDLFGKEKLVLGIDRLQDKTELIAAFDEMVREEAELKAQLAVAIPRIKQMSRKAVDYLCEVAR
ncbi:polysaccharide pyruvyl transferase family protein [Gorillibacterium sp. CAU 1737]|uniref:polysaccharide pyruvyl transferase family protein n=1 Tax=Gorillibacterium sp. CAU 1737 TaxID=3140362 RepID=UPI003260711A